MLYSCTTVQLYNCTTERARKFKNSNILITIFPTLWRHKSKQFIFVALLAIPVVVHAWSTADDSVGWLWIWLAILIPKALSKGKAFLYQLAKLQPAQTLLNILVTGTYRHKAFQVLIWMRQFVCVISTMFFYRFNPYKWCVYRLLIKKIYMTLCHTSHK